MSGFRGSRNRGDGGDTGGDAKKNVAEPSQLIHRGVDFLRTRPLWIENGLGIIKDYDHRLRG